MNPRYRRLLIPGLLVLLIVVVVVSSIAHSARGATPSRGDVTPAHPVVSHVADPRITELSGMAISRTHPDLAYVLNDSGNAPVVYAIRPSTGQVVGTTTVLGGTLRDTEAIALDAHGTLWVADTGDNDEVRTDAALYALPEPGTRTSTVTATRYPVRYADGHPDVEALAVDPRTGTMSLMSKGLTGGHLYALPSTLSRTTPTVLHRSSDAPTFPGLVTDAAYTPDGRYLLVRTYLSVVVYRASDLREVQAVPMAVQPQGESIAVESSGRSYLLGTEGANSTIERVAFDPPVTTAAATSAPATKATDAAGADDVSSLSPRRGEITLGVGAAAGLAVLLGLGVVVLRRALR